MRVMTKVAYMDELKKQFEYYVAHQAEIVEKYNGKFVIIVGEQVVGAFDTEMEAYAAAIEKYEAGTFMLQFVGPGKDNYTQTFHSIVVF